MDWDDSYVAKMPPVGVGAANDLCERNFVEDINRYHSAGLISYLVVYVYTNYTEDFQRSIKAALPRALRYSWHTSGDFEPAFRGDSLKANRGRIERISKIWSPEWATEDVVVANFAQTQPQGSPSFVPMFLTEDCLEACVRKTRRIRKTVPMPFIPEVPHFEVPVPEDMSLSRFFRRFTDQTGSFLNFDSGHFFSYNLMHGRDPMAGIDEFPLDRIFEINLGGGMLGDPGGRFWVDDHTGPIHPLLVESLRYLVPRCPNLRAVYTESIACQDWVLRHNLELLNDIFWTGIRSPKEALNAA